MHIPSPVYKSVEPDFSKSFGSRLYNKIDNRLYLDFFNAFSSVPLSYDSPVLDLLTSTTTFRQAPCAFKYSELHEYSLLLSQLSDVQRRYTNFIPTPTGSSAVSVALRLAILSTSGQFKTHVLPGAYHGIYDLAGDLTSVSMPTNERLFIAPNPNLNIQLLSTSDYTPLSHSCTDILVVEPLRCTSGDIILSEAEVAAIRAFVDRGAILIIDEIQSGFFSSGDLWFHERYGFEPDMICFGKKSQICGVQTTSRFNRFLGPGKPKYFSITFDYSTADLATGIQLAKFYLSQGKTRIKEQVLLIQQLVSLILDKLTEVCEYTCYGLLACLNFNNTQQRDTVHEHLLQRHVLTNKTGTRSIRLRFHLDVTREELQELEQALLSALSKL